MDMKTVMDERQRNGQDGQLCKQKNTNDAKGHEKKLLKVLLTLNTKCLPKLLPLTNIEQSYSQLATECIKKYFTIEFAK